MNLVFGAVRFAFLYRYLIVVCSFVIATSCNNKNSSDRSEAGTRIDFDPKKYCPFIADAGCIWKIDSALEKVYPKTIHRLSNTVLTYTLKSGKVINLKSDLKEGQEVTYHAVNYLPDINLLIVHVMYYNEGGEYLWIDLNNNQKYYAIGIPVLSPDKKNLVCVNSDVIARFSATGIQVWTFKRDKLVKTYENFPKEWGPSSARWIGKDTIKIEREIVVEPNQVETKPIKPITLSPTMSWAKN